MAVQHTVPASGVDVPSVLVIDSGVGGLSICQAITAAALPVQFHYVADNAWFPYGVIAEGRLTQRLVAIIDQALAMHRPDLVVLACNTVSTLVLPELRARYEGLPFVGVVPAIKPAAALSRTRRIGLLATPGTVQRPYTDQLIVDFAADCEVIRVGSSDLVTLAENLFAGVPPSAASLRKILSPFEVVAGQAPVDTVVLGCTHFPLLRDYLAELLPDVTWVDSGAAIARRVQTLLSEQCDLSATGRAENATDAVMHHVYFTAGLPASEAFLPALQALGMPRVSLHTLSLS